MKTIRFLLNSLKFRLALAALVVWVASLVGADLSPEGVAGVLAAVAAWLGVAVPLLEKRVANALSEGLTDNLFAARAQVQVLEQMSNARLLAELDRRLALDPGLAAELARELRLAEKEQGPLTGPRIV
ncbi:MAG: hypothetical protein QM519_02380 [Bacteroidia bacterium]|nr:hypothetical protein [Bacteroidia bacterium]